MNRSSVIIPVYNRRRLILDALDSVLRQDVLPNYVTVVDDGSTDGTYRSIAEWIENYQSEPVANSPTFQLLSLRKSNAAAARQAGFLATPSCDFVSFLDSDDLWPPDYLSRCLGVMAQYPEAVAVSADRRYIDHQGDEFRIDSCVELAASPLRWMFRYGAGVASCTMFRWQAIENAGGWDDDCDCAEDTMLFSRVAILGDWKHAAGDPVTFRTHQADKKNEEGNLGTKYSDRLERWAQAYESILGSIAPYVTEGDQRYLKKQIASYWYRAGKAHQALGQGSMASHCFQKAIALRHFFIRARYRKFFNSAA